jgi:hypothetical protein
MTNRAGVNVTAPANERHGGWDRGAKATSEVHLSPAQTRLRLHGNRTLFGHAQNQTEGRRAALFGGHSRRVSLRITRGGTRRSERGSETAGGVSLLTEAETNRIRSTV